jgi:hypothetical protein
MRAQIISPPSASSLSWEIGFYARFPFEERTYEENHEELQNHGLAIRLSFLTIRGFIWCAAAP